MIRNGTSEDAKAVLDLFRSVQELHATHLPELFKMHSEATSQLEWLTRVFAGPNAYVLIAEWEGAVVGNLLAQEVRKDESVIQPALHYFSLEHLAVAPPFRRRGIGSALVRALFEEAARRQIQRIELQVWSFNDTGQRFFASHGFAGVNQRMAAAVGMQLPSP